MNKSFLLFLILFCCSFLGNAQEMEISLKRYSASDGLPDNGIRALHFDSKGFLWIGTEEGLSRFDGEEFINYKRSSEGGSLSGNVVNDIAEDEEGWLWIATQDGGICRFNPSTNESVRPVLPAYGGSEQNYVYSLWLSANGGMLVGTDKGIYTSKDRKVFTRLNDVGQGSCYKIIAYKGGALTAETRQGVRFFDSDLKERDMFSKSGINDATFLNTIFVDREQRCWLGPWNNFLFEAKFDSDEVSKYDFMSTGTMNSSTDEILCITEPLQGKLWLGTKSGQLWEFDKRTNKSHKLPLSKRETGKLFGNRISCLYTDKYDRTWIGTNNGLHLYDKATSKFEVVYVDEHIPITSFTRVDNKLFIGGLGALYQLKNFECSRVMEGIQIYSLFHKDDVGLLMGTNSALRKYDMERGVLSYPLKANSLYSFDVNSIGATRFNFIHRSKDYIFLNIYGYGVVSFKNDYQWRMNYPESQDGLDNLINGMFEDTKGRVWMFGSLTGLLLCDMNQLETVPSINATKNKWRNTVYNAGLNSKHITAMAELDDGTLWVSTMGGGLYRFFPDKKSKQFEQVNTPFQSIRNMVKTQDNQLWMIASGALLNYNPKENKWSKFDERDGIPKDGLTGSIYTDIDGGIYVGGNGFFIHFNPTFMRQSAEQPRTTLTHLHIMDLKRDEALQSDALKLRYDQNFLTFNFASLCFSNSSSANFKYMLKGLDDEWRDNGTVNFVSYSALPPGKYEFLVKATSAEGVEDAAAASFIFIINSPFYGRWWFVALVALLVGVIIYVIVKSRRNQRLKLELVRNKIARDLHDDIGSALGGISFFSETAKRTLESNNHQNTALVLDKIGSTSREMIENMHDIVWAVNPLNDAFEHVILRMKNYATDLAAANNIQLQFEEKGNLGGLKLSMTERKNLFLIFKEALYNSAKYSNCAIIQVSISQSGSEKLRMTISDNGTGFDLKEKLGKGNGLKNMNTRAKEMGAKLNIESSVSTGTTITTVMI